MASTPECPAGYFATTVGDMAGTASTSATDELPADSLLLPRPHYELRGDALCHLGSQRPLHQLTAAEAELWSMLQQSVNVAAVRERLGAGADLVIDKFLGARYCELAEASFPAARRRVLIIEPHADDAVLSVGGTMWMRRHECNFVIATMASRSNYTFFSDLGSGLGIGAATELRRRESELVARMLGAEHISVGMTDRSLRYFDGEWTDEFYRRHRLAMQASTARVADDNERTRWIDAIGQLLEKERAAEVWIPLGGPHTDHMLTADAFFAAIAAQPSLSHGRSVRVYQEYPYAAYDPRHMAAARAALIDAGAVLQEEHIAIAPVREYKRRLASVYDSQNIDEMYAVPGIDQTELIWSMPELPRRFDPLGVVSQAVMRPESLGAIDSWLTRNHDSPRVRVLLSTPTGDWARDLKLLTTAFPHARFEVYVAAAAAAEVADVPSERVDIRTVAGGTLAWVLLGLKLCIARPAPTLFHSGERREREARLLSRLWLASDALVISTMDHLASTLRTTGPTAEPQETTAPATVAVLVIGRNEGQRLRWCLNSAVREARRLLYVDSGSSDGSVELAQSLDVDTLELDPGTPFSAARARNEGAARLRTAPAPPRYVQFVDGDCELERGWLRTAAAFLDEHADVAVVSGRLREKSPDRSVFNMLSQSEWDLPSGETRSCGGIAMMRVRAFEQARGFRVDLIAGEEPELCLRLLRQGWKIWRLPQNMALHDSGMSRFSQWWKRTLRAGHAFANGVALHGAPPERHYVREYRSALLWGLLIPLATVVLVLCFGVRVLLLAILVYPLQVVRLGLRDTRSARESWLRALFLVIAKFPETLGIMRFHLRRLRRLQPRLIDYK
jgi:GT2 family glycosyltransferase/LmbE family N-acetylglucosaminyl deacetylase